MNILTIIYNLFIGPLELFFEILYAIAFRFIGDPGVSIIFLSLAMNFLVLPLYRRADAMQEEERQRATRMKPWTDHIKKTFSGDERFMMLQTYNRQNGYKPSDALKGSISLLLEIPFFIAAFHFLSNLQLLNGVSFGPLADLGAPDGLITIGGVTVNLLPILMTAINLVSAAIYMKGLPLANKIQMYGIAAIFLVLLYASPAGLVFYWTLNNLFSLVKNIFYKLKNPRGVLSVLAFIAGAIVLALLIANAKVLTPLRGAFLAAIGVALIVPLVAYILRNKVRLPFSLPKATASDNRAFLFLCIFFAVLLGLLIPSSVIAASPAEFVNTADYRSPLYYVAESFALAVGTFVIWFGVFYRLATPTGKSVLGYVLFAVAGGSVVNYLFFGTDYGNLTPQLAFERTLSIAPADMAINLGVVALTAVLLFVVWRLRRGAVRVAALSMCVAVIAMSVVNVASIGNNLDGVRSAIASTEDDESPHIVLSKEGRNVVVVMLDRAVATYVPYIFHERPDIKEQFEGFTFYSNALSYGAFTNTGAPALYGGPDYRPEQLNADDSRPLADKHNESLKVMPTVFSQNNFETKVFDPTYAGYTWIPDLSIYDDVPGVHAYITNGQFDPYASLEAESIELSNAQMPRNLFCYSVFKIAPLVLQPTVYHNGDYNSTATLALENIDLSPELFNQQYHDSAVKGDGVNPAFMKAYAVLCNMPQITSVEEGSQNHFLMMSNDTTHEPCVLKAPEYVPALHVDNTAYELEHQTRYTDDGDAIFFPAEDGGFDISPLMHYHINVAALEKLGDWFDYLRAQGVFDNTRIILVSDHSRYLYLFDELVISTRKITEDSKDVDIMGFNCLLMMKDFDSQELQEDTRFMTNADTPALALGGLVDNPVNPFTGNPLDQSYKDASGQVVTYNPSWNTGVNNGNTFLPGHWFEVHNNTLDPQAWEYLGEY